MAGFFEYRTRKSQIKALQLSYFELERIRDEIEHYLSRSFVPSKLRAEKILKACNEDLGLTLDLLGSLLNGRSPWHTRNDVINYLQRRFAAQLGLRALQVEHNRIMAATNVERTHLLNAMSMLDI